VRRLNFCIILVTSLFSSLANANFYAGIGAGATTGFIIMQLIYPADNSIPIETTYALLAFTPQISLGYERLLNKHWGIDTLFSAEFNPGGTTSKVDNWFLDINANTTVTLPFVYAADILASYQLNDMTHIFFGPGVALGQFTSTSDVTGGTIGISGTYNKNIVGGQFMAGVDLLVNTTFKLRLSDQITFYPTNSTTWVEPMMEEPMDGRYTVITNTVMASVLFNF